MDENKNEQEQIQGQSQPEKDKQPKPKKDASKLKNIVTYVCLGVAVACVVALLVLTYCVN